MSFASHSFVFLLFPAFVAAVFFAYRVLRSPRVAFDTLLAFSVVFYAAWSLPHLALITASITVNYFLALGIGAAKPSTGRLSLAIGVLANLSLLGYFKYTNFFLDTLAMFDLRGMTFYTIALPLGISFYTLQQITYLADVADGQRPERNFPRYALFVAFFPQLIAGPIVSMHEMLPQFSMQGLRRAARRLPVLAPLGLYWFAVGLFKKAVVADNAALIADPLYAKAGLISLSMPEAWLAAFSYGVQLYFDFSGYCDMAIGIALVAGIRLPINFNAPYRAHSIRDFWRRWHMTLSRFLMRFLYIPFGGSRHGLVIQVSALMGTMLIGGLWHGASWTFVIWGAFHGLLLSGLAVWSRIGMPRLPIFAARTLTLVAVMLGWVFFRAETVPSAFAVFFAAFDYSSLASGIAQLKGGDWGSIAFVLGVVVATQVLPTVQDFTTRAWHRRVAKRVRSHVALLPLPERGLPVRSNLGWAVATASLFAVAFWQLSTYSPFIYFQF